MTVYVDDARIRWGRYRMSHLTADTEAELHVFAERLGLERGWFQASSRSGASHYDVSDSKRNLALELGAIPETTGQGAERRRTARAREESLERGSPS